MLHYVIANFDYISRLFNLIQKGGFITIILLDGQTMFDRLEKEPDVKILENKVVKYRYVKNYE